MDRCNRHNNWNRRMDKLDQQYDLLSTSDKDIYLRLKKQMDQLMSLNSLLLWKSCQLAIFNVDEVQRGYARKISQFVLKEGFGVGNMYTVHSEPEFRVVKAWEDNKVLNSGPQNIDITDDRDKITTRVVEKKPGSVHEVLKLDSSEVLYRQVRDTCSHFLSTQKDLPIETVKGLFGLMFAETRKEITQQLWALSTSIINSFQERVSAMLRVYYPCKDEHDLRCFSIRGNPIATLLISKLYASHERFNALLKRVVSCAKTIKPPNRFIVFFKGQLLYCNHQYLNSQLKKSIVDLRFPALEAVIESLELPPKEVKDICQKSKIIGFHQSAGKKWSLLVDRQWSEFVIQIEPCRRLGIINKDQRGYTDLYTTSGQESNESNLDSKAFKSPSLILSQPEEDQKFILPIVFRPLKAAKDINDFQFNILKYDFEIAGILSYQILVTRFPSMGIPQDKLQQFIRKIGHLYEMSNNAFHNIYHMFTALHGAFIISKSDTFVQLLDDTTAFTFLISALCHDVAHTGVTNAFQEKMESPLANRYGDRSILEYNSISLSLKLLSHESTNFLVNFPEKRWREFRKLFVSSILTTDNKNHLAVMNDLELAMKEKAPLGTETTSKLVGGLLHTVDFWGNVKHFQVSSQWSRRINQEYSKQYQRQLCLGVELTPYFKDLNNIRVVAKNELVFISAIISPLYRRVNEWTGGYASLAIDRIFQNSQKWKQLESGVQPTNPN